MSAAGDGLTLHLRWKNGIEHDIDLTDFIAGAPGMDPLRDPAIWRGVTIGDWGWCLHWTDDAEIAASTLWRLALEQDSVRFLHWRKSRGNQSVVGYALGVSLLSIQYYESGTHPIPRTVKLAMVGLDYQERASKAA